VGRKPQGSATTSGPGGADPPPGTTRPDADARESRRAAQLRANLLRRKRQKRARGAAATDPVDE
jgi:hypothetical protein